MFPSFPSPATIPELLLLCSEQIRSLSCWLYRLEMVKERRRASRVYRRDLSCHVVVFRGRLLDPSGRMWCVMDRSFYVVQLWWRELVQVEGRTPDIPVNNSSALATLRDAGRLPSEISFMLS